MKVSAPRPGVVLLTLSRQNRLNSLSAPLMKKLKSALDEAEADDEVQCVALTGEGKFFCAGSDIKGWIGLSVTSLFIC